MLIHRALRDLFCMATCFVYHLFAARGPSYFLIAVLCFLRLTCLLSLLSVSERFAVSVLAFGYDIVIR